MSTSATPSPDNSAEYPAGQYPPNERPTGTTGTAPTGVVVGSYDSYLAAQAAVDTLSDRKFDVSATQVVGHDLRSVEDVKGRMTKGKAALAGAGSGAWFGLLLGILIGIFMPLMLWSALLWGLILGAIWGALFGFIGHLATGGRRDFVSAKAIVAGRYDLIVENGLASQARQLLAQGR